MTKQKQEKLKALEMKIEASKAWYAFCGTLGLIAVLSIPLSVLLGNKTLGLCAISWVAGSFFVFVAEAAKSKRNELEDEICSIKLADRLKVALQNTAPRSVETIFGPISMN